MNFDVNCGPWEIVMCLGKFINCNKCITVARGVVDSGGGYACVVAGHIWEISVPSDQCCSEPKTA